MRAQFFAGVAVAAMALFGLWTYAFWGGEVRQAGSVSETAVAEFTAAARAGVVATVGQPIEGFEPFMFMQTYPSLIGQDFDNVDALIGLYRYQAGVVAYDLNGEQELHSAARAISDEGMRQLLVNITTRLNFDLTGDDTVEDVLRAISTTPGSDPADSTGGGNTSSEPDGTVSSPPAGGTVPADPSVGGPATGPSTTVSGVITCLPHKGDGPHTMECAFGLKADDGKYYGLRSLWEVAPGMTETGVRISVTGSLSAAPANEKYDIAGYIDVRSATQL